MTWTSGDICTLLEKSCLFFSGMPSCGMADVQGTPVFWVSCNYHASQRWQLAITPAHSSRQVRSSASRRIQKQCCLSLFLLFSDLNWLAEKIQLKRNTCSDLEEPNATRAKFTSLESFVSQPLSLCLPVSWRLKRGIQKLSGRRPTAYFQSRDVRQPDKCITR